MAGVGAFLPHQLVFFLSPVPVASCHWPGFGRGGWEERRAETEALLELDPKVEAEVKKNQDLVFWSGDRQGGWGRGAFLWRQ